MISRFILNDVKYCYILIPSNQFHIGANEPKHELSHF